MSFEKPIGNPEKKIARTIEELPPLQKDYVRVIHLTDQRSAENIANVGLNYERHGMLQSMGRAYGNEADVKFESTDPRFTGEHIVAVVMDMPIAVHRKHERVGQAPGIVPPKYVTGIIPIRKGKKANNEKEV